MATSDTIQTLNEALDVLDSAVQYTVEQARAAMDLLRNEGTASEQVVASVTSRVISAAQALRDINWETDPVPAQDELPSEE